MLIRSFTYSLLTKLAVGCVNLLILILSSRYLGVASRGEISIFLLNLMLMQVLNDVYTGFSIIHFIPKFNWRKLVINGMLYTIVVTTFCNLIVYTAHLQIPGYEWHGYALSLLVMLNTFTGVLLLGKQNMKAFNMLSVLQPLLLLLGFFYCVFLQKDFTFSAYFYPLLISFLVSFLLALPFLLHNYPLKKQPGNFSLSAILKNGVMYQFGFWMLIFSNRFSYYLLPQNKDVGLYGSASALAESVLIISSGLSPVLLSRIANNRLQESSAIVLSAAKTAALVSFLAVANLCLLPEGFFTWILGPGFKGIQVVLRIYAPGVVALVFANVLSNFFVAKGEQKYMLWSYGLGFGISLVLAPVLVSVHGVIGASLNALIAYTFISLLITASFLKRNRVRLRDLFRITQDYERLKGLFSEHFTAKAVEKRNTSRI